MSRHIYSNIIIFFITLLLFLWGLSSQEVVSFDSRFYLFAREMLQNGSSWFPTTYQKPYPDYLATSTWIIYALASFMGPLNKTIAVLPTAIAAAFTVCLVYNIATRYNKQWGLYAICMLGMTLPFIKAARGISLDLYPTLITTLVFYVLITRPEKKWLLYGLLLLGFMFRGPIGLVMPAGVICSYYLLNFAYVRLLRFGVMASLLLFVCISGMSLLAYHTGGMTFVHEVLAMQIFGRIDHIAHTPNPWYFYFTAGILDYGLCMPLALMTIGGIAYASTKRQLNNIEKLLIYLFGWMMVIMLGMSIPAEKKIRYLLPMVPAACLLSTYIFVAPNEQTYFRILRKIICSFIAILPLAAFVVISVYLPRQNPAISEQLNTTLIKLLLFVLQMMMVVGLVMGKQNLTRYVLCIATICVLVLNFTILEPIHFYVERSRDFINQIENLRSSKQARLVFYREWPDAMPIKYIAQMKQLAKPVFINNEESLRNYAAPSIFIANQKNFDALPVVIKTHYYVIAKTTLGHVPVYAFTNIDSLL